MTIPRPADTALTTEQFRGLFPSLADRVWLDTPASPPGATPVTDALITALTDWRDGRLDAPEWERAAPAARLALARYHDVPAEEIALLGSVAEAAATVAASLPTTGTVVVGDEEFRSNLFPWLTWQATGRRIVRVPTGPDGRTESILAAIDASTTLVAVSHVLSNDGERVDLRRLRAATHAVRARLFVDATQSLGVLQSELASLRPDYLAVHGYKWLLCPRGAAWLVTPHHDELRPLQPSWKSTVDGGYFGGTPQLIPGAARCDTSPAWLSWIGAGAALNLMSRLPAAAVEDHCLNLALTFREGARHAGAVPLGTGQPSHIVVVRVDNPDAIRQRLRAARIQAFLAGRRLRVGFHYFNNQHDVAAALQILSA